MPIQALENFRKKYPQYDDLSDLDLATKLADKYPAYSDILEQFPPITPEPTLTLEKPEKPLLGKISTFLKKRPFGEERMFGPAGEAILRWAGYKPEAIEAITKEPPSLKRVGKLALAGAGIAIEPIERIFHYPVAAFVESKFQKREPIGEAAFKALQGVIHPDKVERPTFIRNLDRYYEILNKIYNMPEGYRHPADKAFSIAGGIGARFLSPDVVSGSYKAIKGISRAAIRSGPRLVRELGKASRDVMRVTFRELPVEIKTDILRNIGDTKAWYVQFGKTKESIRALKELKRFIKEEPTIGTYVPELVEMPGIRARPYIRPRIERPAMKVPRPIPKPAIKPIKIPKPEVKPIIKPVKIPKVPLVTEKPAFRIARIYYGTPQTEIEKGEFQRVWKQLTPEEKKQIVAEKEKATVQANAYEIERPIVSEVMQEIKEIKVLPKYRPVPEVLKGISRKAAIRRMEEAGFVRIPSLQNFKNLSDKVKSKFANLTTPQRDVVTDAAGAIEKWRAETNKAGLFADWSKKYLNKIESNPKRLEIIDRWLDNPTKYQKDFDKLPARNKQMAQSLKKDYREMRDLARKQEILETWIENYTPHIYKDNERRLRRVLYPQGGRIGKRFTFGRQRKFATMDEAEEAGLHPITNPNLKNAVYKYQLYKTIANKNLIEELKLIVREDGLPVIMGRPRKPEKLRIWENEYQWVNVPSLQRFMYVGETKKGVPMLVKIPAKADPDVARLLNDAFAPWAPRTKVSRVLRIIRAKIKRLIMYNPLIHGWNVMSDVFDEMNFNPYRTWKVVKRGIELYRTRDKLVERAVEAGLQVQNTYAIGNDLREDLMQGDKELSSFFKPINKLEKWSDEVLWSGIVRSSQLGLFEGLIETIKNHHPDWSQKKIDKVAAHYINTLLGTLPSTWFNKLGRESGSVVFFARNWTFSNIDMVIKAATRGRKGLGTASLKRDEQIEIANMFSKHLIKGIFGLLALVNLIQLGFLIITNKMKKEGIIKGEQKSLHLSFANGIRHWYDIDTGLETKTGQEIYLVAPFFRYIRDYIGWVTEPARTLYNKFEPMLKGSVEAIVNYSVWQRREIGKRGAPTWMSIRDRALYFIQGITPSAVFAGRPGRARTPFEWVIPFTGTWIRRGAPGGRMTEFLFEFRAEQGYKKTILDEKIDVHLQKGEFEEAIKMMAETERYTTRQGMADRILRLIAPLNYYWQTTGGREKIKFLKWLKEKKISQNDLIEALTKERLAIEQRGD